MAKMRNGAQYLKHSIITDIEASSVETYISVKKEPAMSTKTFKVVKSDAEWR